MGFSMRACTVNQQGRLSITIGRNFPGVTGFTWHTLMPGTWLLLRFRDRKGVYLLQVLENQLNHPETPNLVLALPYEKDTYTAARKSIVSIRHFVGPLPDLLG